MKLITRGFSELTLDELFEIYKLRVSVFIVEQECFYQDIDEHDKVAQHVWLEDESGIVAYARVLPPGEYFDGAAIGRVLAIKRRKGYASIVVEKAIDVAEKLFNADKIVIEAQVYAKSMYEKFGFKETSEEFLEDGIPHVQMTRYRG